MRTQTDGDRPQGSGRAGGAGRGAARREGGELGAVPALAPPDPFAPAQAQFAALEAYLRSAEARGLTHSDVEREIETRGCEVLRLLYQAHLDARGPGAAAGPVCGADGVARDQARLQPRTLATVFGPVTVRRLGYGAAGAASLHPQDAALNLPPERYSHELRRQAAVEAAKGSFDEAVQSVARHTGTPVAKRQVEALVARAAQDFDAFYTQRQAMAAARDPTGAVLVLTVDGKGVVMRPQDLRAPTRKAAARRTHKLARRLSKGEKRQAKRMATVAAVYTIAPCVRTPEEVGRRLAPVRAAEDVRRPRPEHKRVWASLTHPPEAVLAEAFREAAARDPARAKTWVAVVDGNKPQLALLHKLARQRRIALTVVLDIIHVVEYLWKAAHAFHAEGSPALEAWVAARLLQILRGRASHVAAGIRRSATLQRLPTRVRKPADACANYLLKHARYLRYDQYLAAGLPIASGVIEGACRHLVTDRMDLTGARWSLAGAEAVLRLRALRSSRDFDEYWGFHEAQEHQRNHAARYANGTVVPVRDGKRPHLRVIK